MRVLLYSSRQVCHVEVEGASADFETHDAYSKLWFYARGSAERVHEQRTTQLLIARVEKDTVFADVGAHIGFYSCLVGRKAREGRVYAFEMEPHAAALLGANVKRNALTNVRIVHRAVSDEAGVVRYRSGNEPDPGTQMISGHWNDRFGVSSVPSMSLDSFFRGEPHLPSLVKIDVEGAELKVLSGGRGILASVAPALFIEVHPGELGKFGGTVSQLYRLLESNGYRGFEIVGHRKAGDRLLKEVDLRASPTQTEDFMLLATATSKGRGYHPHRT